ncbi:MAG: hypothetical protein ACE5Q6_06065 [Dehalococcoidia bacterium]
MAINPVQSNQGNLLRKVHDFPERLHILPKVPRVLNWIYELGFVLIIVAAIFIFFALFGEGGTFIERLASTYGQIVDATTDGEKWTHIMRRHNLYLIIPAGAVLFLVGWLAPRNYTGRANLLVLTFAIGFLAGHVFWGEG